MYFLFLRMNKYVILFMYVIVIVVCSWLGSFSFTEMFEVNQLVVDPLYVPGNNNNVTKTSCNVFDCDYTDVPQQLPPPIPEPEPPQPEPVVVKQHVCPPEVTLEEIQAYDLYSPQEQLIDERIAEKQQQYNELEEKMQIAESAYQQKQQAMEEAMRIRQDNVRQLDVAEAERKNAVDPKQDIMTDISKRLMRIETKLNILPV